MQHVGRREQPSFLKMLLTLIPIIAIFVYVFMSLGARDFLWFWPYFEGEPKQITVHCYGEDVVLNPGSEEYTAVNESVNAFLSEGKNWESMGLSDETVEEFREGETQLTVELSYMPHVRIHSMYRYLNELDTIMIPLDGRHSSRNFVFGLTNELPAAGALHYENNDPIAHTIVESNLCAAKMTSFE